MDKLCDDVPVVEDHAPLEDEGLDTTVSAFLVDLDLDYSIFDVYKDSFYSKDIYSEAIPITTEAIVLGLSQKKTTTLIIREGRSILTVVYET